MEKNVIRSRTASMHRVTSNYFHGGGGKSPAAAKPAHRLSTFNMTRDKSSAIRDYASFHLDGMSVAQLLTFLLHQDVCSSTLRAAALHNTKQSEFLRMIGL